MTCWFCGSKMIWGGDHMFDECCIEGEGIVTNLSCSECSATALFYSNDHIQEKKLKEKKKKGKKLVEVLDPKEDKKSG